MRQYGVINDVKGLTIVNVIYPGRYPCLTTELQVSAIFLYQIKNILIHKDKIISEY